MIFHRRQKALLWNKGLKVLGQCEMYKFCETYTCECSYFVPVLSRLGAFNHCSILKILEGVTFILFQMKIKYSQKNYFPIQTMLKMTHSSCNKGRSIEKRINGPLAQA